jgi:hypothetical protein
MKANEYIAMAEASLGKAFPDYVVRLFPDPDDDATFFAYVFCVPDGSEQEAKHAVRAKIRRELSDSEWDVIPSIKNLSVTQEHYPEYLRRSFLGKSVSNSVVLEAATASCNVMENDFQFTGEDLDLMIEDHCCCNMPTHRESHEGQFDIAA